VEEGGGTKFPLLKGKDGKPLVVTPKKGAAIWWPNTLDAQPELEQGLTRHEAMPVISGTKFAANAWIHMHDFRSPNAVVCS